MAVELTIKQACKQSANFMYIWADEQQFLNYIKKKYASVIRTKKANQKKLLMLSADKYGKTYEQYTTAIREAFIETYGMTPAEALVILAQGGQVAGKNWAEGVYGIGAIYVNTFANHADITVRESDGHILQNGVDVTDTSKTVYTSVNKQAVAYQLFATIDSVTYMSQYNKLKKKYYANSYSTAEGTYSARTGNTINASDGADIWGTIISSIQTFVNWLLSLFGVSSSERELISAENTLPNQTADGFVQDAGMSEAGGIFLALAAASVLFAGGLKKKKSVK